MARKIYLTYHSDEDNSHKFYEIIIENLTKDEYPQHNVLVRWGRIGSDGRQQLKFQGDLPMARAIFDNLVAQKQDKGYQITDIKSEIKKMKKVKYCFEKPVDVHKISDYIDNDKKIRELKRLKRELKEKVEKELAEEFQDFTKL